VRSRDALGRDAAASWLLRAGAGDATPRRARRGCRGLEPPALGAARVHALVRATGRAGAAAPTIRPDGSTRRMKVWIDMTAPAHVLVFRPLIEIIRERGDKVEITARDYAQTVELLAMHGLEADAVIGHHAGRSRLQKVRQMTGRLSALKRWAKGRDFDIALAHGSHEL